MPIRLCSHPGCPDQVIYRGRCAKHTTQVNRDTHRNRRIYNSKRWQMTRRKVLNKSPLCPCGELATDADHILAIEDGGDPWALTNLQALCASCHATKTNREVRSR